jgi:hypothetical protein
MACAQLDQMRISNDTACSALNSDYMPAGLVDCRVTGHLSTQSLLTFTFQPTPTTGLFNLLFILRALRGKADMRLYLPADKTEPSLRQQMLYSTQYVAESYLYVCASRTATSFRSIHPHLGVSGPRTWPLLLPVRVHALCWRQAGSRRCRSTAPGARGVLRHHCRPAGRQQPRPQQQQLLHGQVRSNSLQPKAVFAAETAAAAYVACCQQAACMQEPSSL